MTDCNTVYVRSRYGDTESALISAKKNAGKLSKLWRQCQAFLVDRYARFDCDLLIAGCDPVMNCLAAGLAFEAGMTAIIYHDNRAGWAKNVHEINTARLNESEPNLIHLLQGMLKVPGNDIHNIKICIQKYINRVSLIKACKGSEPGLLILNESALVPDSGQSEGLKDKHLFWLKSIKNDLKDMLYQDLNRLVLDNRDCAFIAAKSCLLTSRVNGFSPNKIICPVYELPLAQEPLQPSVDAAEITNIRIDDVAAVAYAVEEITNKLLKG